MTERGVSETSRIHLVDSHTAGEPTRVVLSGGPDLGNGTLAARRENFRTHFDHLRTAIVHEPRGSEVAVGALLVEPEDKQCVAGVIFFNDFGYLGMCGHGAIGVIETLRFLGKLQVGVHRLETPVGIVTATLDHEGGVSIENVASWRAKKDVAIDVPELGSFRGDVAWGGNWFFLCADHDQEIVFSKVADLTTFARRMREAVNAQGFPEVDHVELVSGRGARRAKNFVLCPGGAYDRSPCGTGTSAKLACLAADGALAEGEEWVQESIIGSRFAARFRWLDRSAGKVAPTITGRAFITAETTLVLDPADPFRWGIPRDG